MNPLQRFRQWRAYRRAWRGVQKRQAAARGRAVAAARSRRIYGVEY